MARDDKLAKEAAVTNLRGGSISEINLLALVAMAASLFWSALQSRQSFFAPYTSLACTVDFVLHCVTILLATTVYSNHLTLFSALLLLPSILLLVSTRPSRVEKAKPKKEPNQTVLPIKPFVTSYRGVMIVITSVAILAVDFSVFPRRFAKVETWGTSFMDLGVGSFVFSAGLVAARPLLLKRLSDRRSSTLYKGLRTSSPLVVLGFIRLYSVKSLDYAEHVSEYGVHWNFFFTLAMLPPLVAFIEAVNKRVPRAAIALAVGILYQISLDLTNLKTFVLTAPRTGFISQNREGLVSFWGYLAIFLAGQATGLDILPRCKHSRRVLEKLFIWSFVCCTLFFFATNYKYGLGLSVSRRLANLPYVFWVAAFNTGLLALFCGIEVIFFPHIYSDQDKEQEQRRVRDATSPLLRAYNRNGLAIFLLANLFTGLVNLTLPTLSMSHGQAVIVLVLYMAALSGVASLLDYFDISIKL